MESENKTSAFIDGLLSAFSVLNSYTNHEATFSFSEVPNKGDLKKSLDAYLEHHEITLEEISSDIFSLKSSFKEWLFDTKAGFSDRYPEIEDEAKNACTEILADALVGFLPKPIKVYKMDVKSTASAPNYESVHDDYIFEAANKIYNLHFGVSD